MLLVHLRIKIEVINGMQSTHRVNEQSTKKLNFVPRSNTATGRIVEYFFIADVNSEQCLKE
jgi:hypothetical protein